MKRPLFAGFIQSTTGAGRDTEGQDIVADVGGLFAEARGAKAKSDFFVRALAEKLARAIGISSEEVEPTKVLSDYGIDSPMAVELREWIGKHFQATVAVFEIMSGTPLNDIGDLVVSRSNLAKLL